MLRHPKTIIVGLIAAAGLLGAFAAHADKKSDRGLLVPHAIHTEQGLECTDCHALGPDEQSIPNHDLCSMCHDTEETADDACAFCHTRGDQSVDPWVKAIGETAVFSHEPHLANEVDCAKCHEDPDKARLPAGPIMDLCTHCHETMDAALNECTVCHTVDMKETRPSFRGTERIAHDTPELWKRSHGREYAVDPSFCARCHEDQEAFCEDCHRKNEPDSHTFTWRRKTHGLRAAWNRNACATCHEEDSCQRCHQNTEPRSHRGGWGDPLNRHCISCHLPIQETNCTVCHDRIEHRRALPSPHDVGLFPPNCALCHPRGLPFRAPHLVNSTVRCDTCHGL